MNAINLDALSAEERLLLLEILSEKVSADMPDSLIATQLVYHARFLNGNNPQRKQHRHDNSVQRSYRSMK